MKAKNAMWHSADGRVKPIRELETSHLQNLAAYLQRRAEEHERLMERASDAGLTIGLLYIQGEPVSDWILCILNELARQREKERQAATKGVQKLQKKLENDTI